MSGVVPGGRLRRAMQYLGLAVDEGGGRPRAWGRGAPVRGGGAGRGRGVGFAGGGDRGRADSSATRMRRQVDRVRDGDDLVVIVVFAPVTSAHVVRDAAARAGAGAIGDYRACSFSVSGQGRFEPLAGANPTIGVVGQPEVVEEHRIEVVCPGRLALRALDAMLAVHPYEEPAWHVYRTVSRDELALAMR